VSFRFSANSLRRLEGVHPDLVTVMHGALARTDIDFGVTEGLRTRARQEELVRTGASRTLDGRHLTGHAVDVVAWHRGQVSWHAGHYYPIAWAVVRAARELGTPVRWGGCWQEIQGAESEDDLHQMVVDYGVRQRARGRRVFFDGPHFELPRRAYP
jgi:peptidoglycan L-alanyl-D-glutamate endopeptidase CwlK